MRRTKKTGTPKKTTAKRRAPKKTPAKPTVETSTKKNGKETPGKAMIDAMVQQERIDRENACQVEVNDALEKHQCVLVGQTVIRGQEIQQNVIITAQ